MTIKKTIAAAGAALLALVITACGDDEPVNDGTFQPADPSTQTDDFASTDPLDLSETVTIGNTLTISDIEIDTTGCDFYFAEDVTRDSSKFELVATVENQTGEEISEALWASDFTFVDADGLTVSNTDMVSAEGPCDNSNNHQFLGMKNGEKRRAAVTLQAPAGATTMTYSSSTIEDAEDVTWDIEDVVAPMEITSPQ